MSTVNQQNYVEGKWMIPIEDVVHIRWTEEKAINLKRIRKNKKISLRSLAIKVTEKGQGCTYSALHGLETPGKVGYTTLEFILAICEVMEEDIRDLYPMIFLG